MLQQQKRVTQSLPISLAQTIEVKMEVVFGTPSQNCIGSGVCMLMNRFPRHKQLPCPHAPAWISFEYGQLVFRFSKAEVLRADVASRLDPPWFLVEESFPVPRCAVRHLGLPAQHVSPGIYRIVETNKDWFLAFPLARWSKSKRPVKYWKSRPWP